MPSATIISGILLALVFLTNAHDENFVKNGDFEQPRLQQSYIITNDIPGWHVHEGELDRGRILNTNWGNTQVIELDGHRNTNYKSVLQLPE